MCRWYFCKDQTSFPPFSCLSLQNECAIPFQNLHNYFLSPPISDERDHNLKECLLLLAAFGVMNVHQTLGTFVVPFWSDNQHHPLLFCRHPSFFQMIRYRITEAFKVGILPTTARMLDMNKHTPLSFIVLNPNSRPVDLI